MSGLVVSLPMYDWRERREEVDAEWEALRDRLRAAGVDAPERLARSNADLPPVPGGIRDSRGEVIAPDPATLAPDNLDLPVLWRHPGLLLAQTCWGPLDAGLAPHVAVLHQPDYSAYEGGERELYSSAILVRRQRAPDGKGGRGVPPPADGRALIPLDLMRGARLAFGSPDSMSGLLALQRDLEAQGEGLEVFSQRLETGGHRASIVAVAEGRADVCAVDCRSWSLARRFEPRAADLQVAGWTMRRKGLPYVASGALEPDLLTLLRGVVGEMAMLSAYRRADSSTAAPAPRP